MRGIVIATVVAVIAYLIHYEFNKAVHYLVDSGKTKESRMWYHTAGILSALGETARLTWIAAMLGLVVCSIIFL